MIVLKKIKDINNHLKFLRIEGKTIGFVPTMGALHGGHISLIETCKKKTDITVCSIFVNPTQFNDKADFRKYPNLIDSDIEKLEAAACNILFHPSIKEMYPKGFVCKTKINFGYQAETLEGEFCPGHFNGMAQIVEKFLKIIKPDKLFMGQKDFQQQMIVGLLIKKKKIKTELIVLPTMREKDGLAMSSRNVQLDKISRNLSLEIYRTLKGVKAAVYHPKSEIGKAEEFGRKRLSHIKGIEVEYFKIRNAETLKPAKRKTEKLIALTAVKIGGVRLIDNMLLN